MDEFDELEEPDEFSPLASALMIRDFEEAARLIADGACLDDLIGEDDSNVPLHNAARYGDTEMLDFYLGHDCPKTLEQFDFIQQTPLICAADNGKTDVVIRLLAAGADPNSHDEARAGNTAIREAVRGGHTEIVSLLLQAGADPTIPGWMQISAVDQAWCEVGGSRGVVWEIRAMLAKYPSSVRDRKINP